MSHTTADFDYTYPPGLVAQRPLPDRDASRLLILARDTGTVKHGAFRDFPQLLAPGDTLVVNASRVIAARLVGIRENGREAEVLLVQPAEDNTWLAMVHPGGKLKVGRTLTFPGDATLEIIEVLTGGVRRVRLDGPLTWDELMQRHGTVPIPPYITRPADTDDSSRYQTVYADAEGSIAAPTAGLHFTDRILHQIEVHGVTVAHIILHVGPGTFKPVQTERVETHQMHAEWFSVPQRTVEAVAKTRDAGGRVWAVGTTTTRVLETVATGNRIASRSGWTDLFIHPPFRFQVVDGLLTNFHQPRSTLLMLVCAFGGTDRVMAAYREAVANEYRLYSYGDAMVIA